jgi:hypothetical protein
VNTLFAAIYASPWHHPGLAFFAGALLFALFRWVVPTQLRGFTLVAGLTIVADAFFTGALSPVKEGGLAQWLAIGFVIAGDLRYFYLVENDIAPRGAIVRALALSFVVPLSQTLLMKLVDPAMFTSSRITFLSYEALFVLFCTLHWTLRGTRGAPRFLRLLFAYELALYVLWACADVLLLQGFEAALLLRIVPNALYYAGFLWFVVWSWRRHA